MKELFPGFLRTPKAYAQAAQYWEKLWGSVCTSDEWRTGWLNTSTRNGVPFMDGDGILNAIHRRGSRAFKVVQRPRSEAVDVHVWSELSELATPPVQLTVIAGPLTARTADRFKAELQKLCEAD